MEISIRYVSHVSVAPRTLFNFRRHVLCELSKKYGHAVSVYGMKQLVFKKFVQSKS